MTLLQSDEDSLSTLNAIAAHLEPSGSLLVDLDCPDVTRLRHSVGRFREEVVEGDARIGMTEIEATGDQRNLRMRLRYERTRPDGGIETLDRDWYRRTCSVGQFGELLEKAGFEIDSVTKVDGHTRQVCAKLSGRT